MSNSQIPNAYLSRPYIIGDEWITQDSCILFYTVKPTIKGYLSSWTAVFHLLLFAGIAFLAAKLLFQRAAISDRHPNHIHRNSTQQNTSNNDDDDSGYNRSNNNNNNNRRRRTASGNPSTGGSTSDTRVRPIVMSSDSDREDNNNNNNNDVIIIPPVRSNFNLLCDCLSDMDCSGMDCNGADCADCGNGIGQMVSV